MRDFTNKNIFGFSIYYIFNKSVRELVFITHTALRFVKFVLSPAKERQTRTRKKLFFLFCFFLISFAGSFFY